MKNKIELHKGDCLELMKDIPDKSIDMILCDLPYGTTACKWDVVIQFEPLWIEYKRVIKDRGCIALFGSEPFSSYLRMSNIKNYKYDLIWKKNFSGGFATANKRPMCFHENISIFYKAQPVYNSQKIQYRNSVKKRFKDGEKVKAGKGTNIVYGGLNYNGNSKIKLSEGKHPESILEFNVVPNCNGIRQHQSQKPLDLLSWLIKTYTLENETVLDNCMGSGSTGVACINTKRNFIGIEKDDKYFEIAESRIEQTLQSKKELLFT